jgi:hypothetical protein
MRLNADLESGRSLVSHPRRKAGKGAVKLVHNEKRGAASPKPPPNADGLAEAGVKSVSDACFSLLFVGSMSPFRGGVALRADCRSCDKSGRPSYAASSACHKRPTLSRCFQPSDAPAGHIGGLICEDLHEVDLTEQSSSHKKVLATDHFWHFPGMAVVSVNVHLREKPGHRI